MRKTMMMAAFAAAMAASPLAFAQTAAARADASTSNVTVNRIEPGQVRATNLRGSSIYDAQSNKVGSVRDIVLDRSGRVAAVVIDVDGKDVGVPMSDLHIAMTKDAKIDKVTIDRTRAELKSAEAFDLNNMPNTSSGSSAPPATAPVTRHQ